MPANIYLFCYILRLIKLTVPKLILMISLNFPQIQTYFVCDICLQSYNARDKLEEHKTHHENPKPLQCGVCLTAYVSQEEYDSHLCITYK